MRTSVTFKDNHPLVSVIIPTYNHGKYIESAIKSVIAQEYANKEIIVVDDGSVDNTCDVVAKYHDIVKYHYQDNMGESAARNHGLSIANGEYFAFLDADDMWLPNKLTKQLEVFRKKDSIGMVGCGGYDIDESGIIISPAWIRENYSSRDNMLEALSIHQIIPGSSSGVLIKANCFKKVGYFNVELKYGPDWDMWLRIAAHYDIYFVSEPLVLIRKGSSVVSKGNMTCIGQLSNIVNKEEKHVKTVIDQNIKGKTKRRAYANLYFRTGSYYLTYGYRGRALIKLLKSIAHWPLRIYPKDERNIYRYPKDSRYYLLIKALIPNIIITYIKNICRK